MRELEQISGMAEQHDWLAFAGEARGLGEAETEDVAFAANTGVVGGTAALGGARLGLRCVPGVAFGSARSGMEFVRARHVRWQLSH